MTAPRFVLERFGEDHAIYDNETDTWAEFGRRSPHNWTWVADICDELASRSSNGYTWTSREEMQRKYGEDMISPAAFGANAGHTVYVTKTSGDRDQYDGGMVRDNENGKPRFDLLFAEDVAYHDQMLTRVAKLLSRGAEHYGARNWEKAEASDDRAMGRYKSSAYRHLMQWLCGEDDEDHAAAVIFNLIAHESIEAKA